MKNEKNNTIKRKLPIFIIVIAIVTMLPVIVSLLFAFLPVILLGLFGLLVFAVVRHIFFKRKKAKELPPQEEPIYLPQPETEAGLIQKAFGLLQRRISEELSLRYPGARWVWGVPNALDHFANNAPLIIILNGAGGYNKAQVFVQNLLFKGICCVSPESSTILPVQSVTIETELSEDADDSDDVDVDETEDSDDSTVVIISDDAPVNYGRLAFEWVDANMMEINAKYNEAIAQNESELLIPAADLPHPDSWTDLCDELKRNGFSVADFCEDGIKVNITK